ncbi:putative membrane protein [Rhodococcus sp. MTM3W5.2]|uniref:hypothetical protein n=1 Tax=Rhodococcus sp. MTM3W5.2 TaxID=1805827 RepID=UPI000979296C|nr:hypothetical protein [Rhodococcus sp. MTM3W5.2]AQA22930.1 putative membrane protein [Rhodococcus sp. MTM3W5.2]
MRSKLAVLALAVVGSAVVTAASAGAAPGSSGSAGSSTGSEASDARFETLCTPTDPGLAEISGLVSTGETIYAIGDSGTDDEVWVLDNQCQVTGTVAVPPTPVDVEDMAMAGGRLWLSDTGDNTKVRQQVSLTGLDPVTGAGAMHLLTYPDGPHDAETLLVGHDGRPVIVTKEILAASGIYRPAGGATLDQLGPGPAPLQRIGQIAYAPTDTPGSPMPVAGSILVTGGAVSADGRVVAVRTYTDVYLYPAPDGDIAAALTGATPVRVPMPDQPQGEAIAFTPDGDLLSASEANGGPLPPIQVLRGATGLVDLGA